MLKSSGWPWAMWCRWRSRFATSPSVAFTSWASRTLTVITPTRLLFTQRPPSTRFLAVESGMKAVSSWSWPKGVWPLAASTPTTCIGTLLTRTILPIGSCARKQLVGHGRADQDHLAGAAILGVGEGAALIDLPVAGDQIFVGHALDAGRPVGVAGDDLELARHRRRCHLDRRISRCSAWASSSVSEILLPEPPRAPPMVREPFSTIMMLEPRLSIVFFTRDWAPDPIATMAITDEMPMMMPSEVRMLRSRLLRNAREADRRVSGSLIVLPRAEADWSRQRCVLAALGRV